MKPCDVKMTLKCRNLIKMDLLSKSDPMVKVHCRNQVTHKWDYVGHTEVLQNAHNPDFEKVFAFTSFRAQEIKFEVYDADEGADGQVETKSDDLMGHVTCYVQNLLDEPDKQHLLFHPSKSKRTKSLKKAGSIVLVSCEIEESDSDITQIQGALVPRLSTVTLPIGAEPIQLKKLPSNGETLTREESVRRLEELSTYITYLVSAIKQNQKADQNACRTCGARSKDPNKSPKPKLTMPGVPGSVTQTQDETTGLMEQLDDPTMVASTPR